jgi:hypothetical protein
MNGFVGRDGKSQNDRPSKHGQELGCPKNGQARQATLNRNRYLYYDR